MSKLFIWKRKLSLSTKRLSTTQKDKEHPRDKTWLELILRVLTLSFSLLWFVLTLLMNFLTNYQPNLIKPDEKKRKILTNRSVEQLKSVESQVPLKLINYRL